jgi:carbonic anhydrase
MTTLIPVDKPGDILPKYRGTSVEWLLRYHNLGEHLPDSTGHAELLVGMCMDHRKYLTIPNEFAYVLRAAGGSLRDSEFEVSYAVAIGGISTIALLGHTDCGMTHVTSKRDAFVRGLVERGGWEQAAASDHFSKYATQHEIGDPAEFVVAEAARLGRIYPKIMFAALLYRLKDDHLMQITDVA